MFRQIYILLILLSIPAVADAQMARSLSMSVSSPRMEFNGEWDAPAVMQLGSDDRLVFSFDEMSHTYHRYLYRITHRNADWSRSDMLEIDYLDGFNDMPIEDWENSVNTTQLYTRYEFSLPNENVSLKLSGNYRLEILDGESPDETPVAVFDFSVVEPRVAVRASVSGNTDRSFNDGEQQLSFVVDYSGYSVSDPAADLKPVVYQNRRLDNAVAGIKPTYIRGSDAEYIHNDKLIFEAGNEYRRFELTDPNMPGMNVEEVVYHAPDYHALLYVDKERRSHSGYNDENGRYFVNTLEGYGSIMEADYIYVHFALELPYRTGGDYYLIADFAGEPFSPLSRLDYDAEGGYYFTSRLLKTGVYNYMYVWLPDGESKGTLVPAEGACYETDNEYLIYVYHRAFGERYDRLVGVRSIRSSAGTD